MSELVVRKMTTELVNYLDSQVSSDKLFEDLLRKMSANDVAKVRDTLLALIGSAEEHFSADYFQRILGVAQNDGQFKVTWPFIRIFFLDDGELNERVKGLDIDDLKSYVYLVYRIVLVKVEEYFKERLNHKPVYNDYETHIERIVRYANEVLKNDNGGNVNG